MAKRKRRRKMGQAQSLDDALLHALRECKEEETSRERINACKRGVFKVTSKLRD